MKPQLGTSLLSKLHLFVCGKDREKAQEPARHREGEIGTRLARTPIPGEETECLTGPKRMSSSITVKAVGEH